MARGVLTPKVQEKAIQFLGREISVRELRLMPYVLNCLLNNDEIELVRINANEETILSMWIEAGFIKLSPLKVTKPFYDFMNELVFISYIESCDRSI